MTAGSRGDVAPYTGLGHGLVRAGHEVTLVTHAPFAPLVSGSGVRFHPLPVDPRAELESSRGRGLHHSTTRAGKLVRVASLARSLIGTMTDDLLAAARSSDLLLVAPAVGPVGHTLAEGLGLPSLDVPLQPLIGTREFAPPMLSAGSWGAVGNRVAGQAVALSVEQIFSGVLPGLRRRLGLPRRGTLAAWRARERLAPPVLHGFSSLVVPRPRDWRPGLDITGYWWPYDADTRLPAELRDFLDAGPPPVFVGLGSATVPRPDLLSAAVVRALRRAGLRGVFQRGWGELAAHGPDMLTVGEVPHALLFPRVAAVVHHAGAGTTAAGLRAGVPAVPVPIQFDEGFWASRLVRLGVAPHALALRRLSEDALRLALTHATRDPAFARRARDLGARIRAEDGVSPVLAAVERLRPAPPAA
ncbi:glycosyltransferase [Streptomyces sp. ACT015]|uniref:glycosyltransferase n=1 Tax=Streptomyces sp. ACT015 TaxID=3134807 RepID=UPI003D16CBAC